MVPELRAVGHRFESVARKLQQARVAIGKYGDETTIESTRNAADEATGALLSAIIPDVEPSIQTVTVLDEALLAGGQVQDVGAAIQRLDQLDQEGRQPPFNAEGNVGRPAFSFSAGRTPSRSSQETHSGR